MRTGWPASLAIASAAGLTVAALLLIEPACAQGPFGMVDPAIWPIWLAEVREMQPLLSVFQKNPLTGAAIAAFPALAVVAALLMLQDRAARRDMGSLAAAAAFLICGGGDARCDPRLLLRDLARHADGRRDGAAVVRGAAAQDIRGAAGRRVGADAARAVVGRHHHRPCGRARRPRSRSTGRTARPASRARATRRWRNCRRGSSRPTSATDRTCWR